MARFTAVVEVGAPAGRTWAALVDWPAHGRWTPLTSVRVTTPAGTGAGACFVARTAVGPMGFDDPMQITQWEPPEGGRPGRCRVAKTGRVVLGSAAFEVSELPGGRSRVVWSEDVALLSRALSWPLRPLLAVVGKIAFTWTLRQLAAEVERAEAGRGRAAP